MDPFTSPCSFQNLLNSQQPYPSVSDASAYGTGWPEEENEEADIVSDRKERRKWSPTEDKVLISAWLNTSKDPIVSNGFLEKNCYIF